MTARAASPTRTCQVLPWRLDCHVAAGDDAAELSAVTAAASQHCFLPDVAWRMHGAASTCADPVAKASSDEMEAAPVAGAAEPARAGTPPPEAPQEAAPA